MKKIAFFLDYATRQAFYARIAGMQKRIEEQNLDINICFFRSRAAENLDFEYNVGEYNIYELPDLKDFDGIILDLYNVYQAENYWYGADISSRIIRRAARSGKPVISIGNRIEGFYYVGIENYQAMTGMIDYMYDRKGCRKFWFLMGPKDNYENRLRTRALQDYLLEREGRDYSEYFYYESYESITGKNGFRYFCENEDGLPDAVICANDRIAIGAAEEAARRGYRIPEDFFLTGFDNIEASSYFRPGITTVDQRWTEPGGRCIDLFCELWNGRNIPLDTFLSTDYIFRASTGDQEEPVPAHILNGQIYADINQEVFDSTVDRMEYGLLSCNTLREIGEVFLNTFTFLNCKALYLVLDEKFYDFETEDFWTGWNSQGEARQTEDFEGFLTSGYPEHMKVAFSCREGRVTMENRSISGLFPFFEEKEGGHNWLFLPVHFRKYTVGFFAIREAVYLIRNPYILRAISALGIAIENLYRKEKLRRINLKLSRISITDTMTGFYNRYGYRQLAFPMFEQMKRRKESLLIIFIDMDHLKYINDTYGHECGDYAIIAITRAIRKACPRRSLPVRLGGDEFLVLLEEDGKTDPEEILQRIREEIPRMEETRHLQELPSVSAGYLRTDAGSDKTLEDYVRDADQLMYQQKSAGRQCSSKEP